jgi:alpha-mannosidase
MNRYTAHIINHTHWDREWFLTSVYTNQWIPGLIDKLTVIVEKNPDFHFLLDGQTLTIEDLLSFAPQYGETIDRLVGDGSLLIGPYYCQPDWRITSGEALLRNLLLGRWDLEQHGGQASAGWLVDTFGHISQTPQLHRLFGIDSVYIWRGAPKMKPYLDWRGADGSRLFTVNLFGGYRNLYGVTHAPEIAVERLQAELDKLGPLYPTPDIPLFDGYDLEDDPEDPLRFFQSLSDEIPPNLTIREATPSAFAGEMETKIEHPPPFSGEMISGKFGAVFPGTLSTRDYLKVMNWDCDHLLYRVCEPLGTLAAMKGRDYPADRYRSWSRRLLQNAVHDCLCGVSIDQVHEKMEYTYRQVFEAMQVDIQHSLAYILKDFEPGTYAVSANPFPYKSFLPVGENLLGIRTGGVGVWKIEERLPVKTAPEVVDDFHWKNEHYEASVLGDGKVQVGEARLGSFMVSEERGDAYSGETGALIGELIPDGALLLEGEAEGYARIRIPYSAAWGEIRVSAVVHLTFDQSPLIGWQIELDSKGTDFRVDFVFETGLPGRVYAGMPFDVVERPAVDRNLMPRQLDESLADVLVGQRELIENRTFPFQEFVAVSDEARTAAVLASGLHSYEADDNGTLSITLRRALEWLTKPDLERRVGDAGPFFYVPDARCERKVTHRLAFMPVSYKVDDVEFMALNAGFHNPPLVVTAQNQGLKTSWRFFQEQLPLSSLQVVGGRVLARLFNPGRLPARLSKAYPETDVFGVPKVPLQIVEPKKILNLDLGEVPASNPLEVEKPVEIVSELAWRVGPNQAMPDEAILLRLEEQAARLKRQIEKITLRLERSIGNERYRWRHAIYIKQRELLETRLSIRLNELKQAAGGELDENYLFDVDGETASIGRELNRMRIKRRIYDYIVQLVEREAD